MMNYEKLVGTASIADEVEAKFVVPSTLAAIEPGCPSPTAVATAMWRFQSSYTTSNSTIQDIVRNLSWNDPFYDHCSGVIAAFDIDVKKAKESLKQQVLVCSLSFLVFFSLALYITFTVENGAFAWLYLGYPILLALIVGLITCRELNMVACRHVAITSRGVWLDMSDGPASLLLAQRQVYKFESIDGCYVFSSGFLRPIFQVVIAIKGAPPMGGSHVISGLSNGQAFVDLVTALMEVDSTTSEPAVFVQAVATQGEQDRFPL